MNIELTDQQRQLAQEGQPIDVVDPQTNEAYVLIARQRFEQIRSLLTPITQAPLLVVPEGIRLSQEAFRRDLPQLLKQKRLVGHRRLSFATVLNGDWTTTSSTSAGSTPVN